MEKFKKGKDFDWDDLSQLVRRSASIDRDKITADCTGGYRFLTDLTEEEWQLSNDPYQREFSLWKKMHTNQREAEKNHLITS